MRIAMYGGALRHWGLLYPNALDEDVPSPGGTELAMMQIARALAKRGHRVTVFAECEPGTFDGVDYLKADSAVWLLAMLNWDVVVSWQDAAIFLHPLKSRMNVLMSQSAHLGVGQLDYAIHAYFAPSRFAAQLLLDNEPYADPSKMRITRNGVSPSRYEVAQKAAEAAGLERKAHRLVWASSPDRGLHHLLPIFRRVREMVPDAELAICYDFDKTLASYRQTQPGSTFLRFLEQADSLKAETGVTFYQHLSQPKLAELFVTSGVLVYPCDPVRPTETYCNVISEALAAGMLAFVSDVDCLNENYADWADVLPLPIEPQVWASSIVAAFEGAEVFSTDQGRITDTVLRICSYDEVAREWEEFFSSYFDGYTTSVDKSLAAARSGALAQKLVPHG